MNYGLPLTLVTFFPLAGMLVIALMSERQRDAIRWIALGTSVVTFGLSLWVLRLFQAAGPGGTMALETNLAWLKVGGLAINYHLGADGLSMLMVLLTTVLTPVSILSSWNSVQDRVKGFMLFFLMLETGMIGVFLALDLVLFYVFWEFTLVPMYFLIGIWGGERRIYAAVKFFLFTMSGSLLMLLAILYMGFSAGTFDWAALVQNRALFAGAQTLLFLAFGLAFAIKVPMFPLHTWLPDAHVEAPTAGSVILAGVMLKMGAYGLIRFNLPLFPEATVRLAPWMAVLAVIGILYGAAVSFMQKDMKKLVAYSSVSHLGFVVLGIFALTQQSLAGGILQMVNHGLSTGALFLIVGMLYERKHTREMAAYGGVWKIMPYLGALMLVVILSSVGLPGLNGFVGEFTILLGSFGSRVLASPWFAGIATIGVILAAVYLFTLFEKVFLGPVTHEENRKLLDITPREVITLLPLLIGIFWIGLYPKFFFTMLNPTVERLITMVQAASVTMR